MAQTSGPMTFDGAIAVKYDGTDIFAVWIGTTFVWPDPWVDIWDEGTNLVWENVWHNVWSDNFTVPEMRTPNGNQQRT